MKTSEIIYALRGSAGDVERVRQLTIALAERLAALESREEVRYRIEPLMRGEKPEEGVGR